jgi:hypothetical protein
MDKKTKLYVGIGVVAVGAYLLLKSKKSTPSLTKTDAAAAPAPDPAKFVGMINELNSPTQKYTNLAGVGDRMIAVTGGVMSDRMKSADGFGSVGQRMIAATGGMINTTDVVGARAGSKNSGIFANQPFTGDVANLVGANGDKVFANQTGKFFKPRTARYGQNEGVFAPRMPKTPMPMPRRTLPVEPNMPVPVTQGAPLNNLVGQDGSRFFSVHDGFGK